MVHDILFDSNNPDDGSGSNGWGLLRYSPVLHLTYCSRTFDFFHPQTADFNNTVCAMTQRLINESPDILNILVSGRHTVSMF